MSGNATPEKSNSPVQEKADQTAPTRISNDYDVSQLPDNQRRVVGKVMKEMQKYWFVKVLTKGDFHDKTVFIHFMNLAITEGYKRLYLYETVEFDIVVEESKDGKEQKYTGINVSGIYNSKLNVENITEDNIKHMQMMTHTNEYKPTRGFNHIPMKNAQNVGNVSNSGQKRPMFQEQKQYQKNSGMPMRPKNVKRDTSSS